MTDKATWLMYAHLRDGMLVDIGTRAHVVLQREPYPVVEVEVRVVEYGDPRATHFGWIEAGKEAPTMIWPTWDLYRACFQNGPEVQEAGGYGKTVRLAVQARGLGARPTAGDRTTCRRCGEGITPIYGGAGWSDSDGWEDCAGTWDNHDPDPQPIRPKGGTPRGTTDTHPDRRRRDGR